MTRKVLFAALCACVATSYGEIIHDSPDGGTPAAWNWTGGALTSHVASVVDYSGNNVIQHTGMVGNTATNAVDSRMGSKWDLTVSGNTSADPADYIVSFDVRNLSGNWDPIPLSLAVLTKEAADDQGYGYATQNIALGSGWTHVELNLADSTGNWWQGNAWDLTNPNWSLELSMPWPGVSVAGGESFTQVWETDNLQIEMIPEPATIGLIGIFGAGVLFVRRRFMI